MESLSRPFHRKKLSNASSFSGKNASDGVFSGHRPNFDGVPPVNVEEYREIFSSGQAASSIPVLDLSTLQDSSDGLNLEVGSSKPDYGKIFGGFRDHDIALSYEELVSRDKARAPSSTCLKLQDLGDLSHQPLDDLKQFNMSYNKINKTSKDGLDGTTHVTQLHAVPGFTCFIDESASQPKKENENQKSSTRHNIHPNVNSSKRDFPQKQASQSGEESKSKDCQNERLSDDRDLKAFQSGLESHPYKVSSSLAASQPKKESENQKSSVTNNVHHDVKVDIPEKKTSQNAVESRSRYNHDESLFDDRNFKTFQADHISHPSKESSSSPAASSNRKYCQNEYLSDDRDLKAFQADLKRHPSKVFSSPAASQPIKETENQKCSVTNNVHGVKADFPEKVTSQNTVESRSRDNRDESLSNDRNFKTFQANHISRPSKVSSSSSAASANHKDYQKTSTATGEEFPPATWFDENLDVNSAAAVSAAALRKALEKAQESIRIAKESVGRKKEGLKGFSSKSFKDSLKVKKARVANVSAVEEQKVKEDTMKETDHELGGTVIFSDFEHSEKLFGANKVIKEIHGKISESTSNSEIPVRSPFELRDNKIACNTKLVADKTESELIKINKNEETAQKDNERPNGCLLLESCEKKLLDMQSKENKDTQKLAKSNNLTVYQKVEVEKKLSLDSYQNGDEKRFGEATLGLLENMKQEVPKQEHDEKVANAERQVEDEREDTENHKEEKFNEVEMFKNAQTDSISTNEVSPNDYYETKEKQKEKKNDKAEEGETWENLDDKFQEAETYENSSSEYDDAEGSESVHGASHIVDDTEEVCNVNNTESSQEFDEVSSSSSTSQEFQIVDDTEKDILEDIPADQTPTEANNDEHEVKSDDLSIHGLTDIDFAQNDVQSDSSSDTIHGMEIEVKEYNERKETVEEETDVSVEKKEENNVQQFHEERPEIRIEMETGTCYQEAKDESRAFGPDKVVEKENNKRIEEVSAEERERERIKLAVERAIREARERAFAEARERAALDRATSQGRQRVMADFQEKATKASDKTSALLKLRAERAAVERATAEARQRALEKAISQKKMSQPKIQVNEIKQTSSCSSSVSHTSALRSKAKLEKDNRIMERAAKALAEKEKRDLLVLREQAERSRLAESLDADIKRWSTGKEGNLRALLSTLQYILGADSGWQPVSLTEIITTNAVKKAYRKATLCVHPDKLQQRGASIQQKYICEKVFDLLKAAWNKFNSEER